MTTMNTFFKWIQERKTYLVVLNTWNILTSWEFKRLKCLAQLHFTWCICAGLLIDESSSKVTLTTFAIKKSWCHKDSHFQVPWTSHVLLQKCSFDFFLLSPALVTYLFSSHQTWIFLFEKDFRKTFESIQLQSAKQIKKDDSLSPLVLPFFFSFQRTASCRPLSSGPHDWLVVNQSRQVWSHPTDPLFPLWKTCSALQKYSQPNTLQFLSLYNNKLWHI